MNLSPVQHELSHWTPFLFVRCEQLQPSPAFDSSGQLPTQIKGVRETHIHSVSARRNCLMAGITSQEDPVLWTRVRLGNSHGGTIRRLHNDFIDRDRIWISHPS